MRKLYTPEKENCLVVDKRSQAVFSTIYRTTFLVFILFVFSLISGNLRAQSNIYESYAILNINNAGNSYYDLQATTANPDFEGADLGTFYSSNSLVLNGAQNKIYKCGTDDVIDGWFYYRIYKTTDVAPAFSAGQKIFYNMDIGASGQCSPNEVDQIWESSGAGIDVLSGLTPGTYYLEMYTTANFTYSGGSGTHYANNGGNNYKATFTVAANCINGVSISPTSLSSLCLGAASPTLTATISTQSGAGAANISYEWFSNTVNNNTTGTAISGTLLNTTTATTSSTYSPPTTVAGTVYYYCVVTNLDPTCSGSYVTDPVEVIVNSNPSVALTSQTNVLCYGASTGTIDITASGGVAPYTYAWTGTGVNPTSEDQSGLAAGTYTVVVTDANGCSTSTLTVNITEPASPVTVALTSQTNVLCYGASTGAIDITASGGVAPYTYAWTGTGVNPTSEDQSGLAAGTYTVVVTDANGCSTSTLTVTITEPASPVTVALTSQTDVLCYGASTGAIDITASGGVAPYTYAWTGTGVNPTSEDQSGLAAGTYTVVVTDANGCSTSTLTVTLTEPASPVTVALTSQTNVLCYGASTGTIDITASGGVAPYTYAWTGTGVNPTSEDQSGLAAGTYTVVVTDANGCSTSTLTVTITEPASPVTVALTSQTNVLCYGASTGTIDITASGGVAPYTYAWTGTGVNPTSEDQSGLAAGTYTVVVTDANGCSTSTLTVTITEPASPVTVALTSQTNVLCYGASTGAIDITASGGVAPYTYAWTGTGVNPTSEDQSGLAAGTYTVVVTDANGCSTSTLTVNITEPASALTINTITSNSPICEGDVLNLTASASGGTGGISYSWTGPGGFTSSLQNPTIPSATLAASGLYSLTVTDANGCTANSATTVVVNPLPTAVLSGTATICNGDAATLLLTVTGSGTITGTISDGTNTYSFSGTAPIITVDVTPSVTSTYTITTLQDAHCTGTSMSGSATVTVNQRPTATLSGSQTICAGGSATLTLSVTGTGTISGSLSDGTLFSGAAPTITVTVSPTTTTTYSIISLTNGTCSSIASDINGSATVTVNPRPTATLSGTATICDGTTATLLITVTGSGTITGTLSDGTPFSGTAPTISVNVSPSVNTTYSIASLQDANCTGTASDWSGTATVTVKPKPVAVASVSTQTICSGSPISQITLTTSPNVPGTIFNWTKDQPGITGIASPNSGNINGTLTNPDPTPATVTFTITPSADGCVGDAITSEVIVNPIPVLSNTLPLAGICNNTSPSFTPTSATPGTQFTWTRPAIAGINSGNPGSGSHPGIISEILSNSTTGTINVSYNYTLSYTNAGKTCTNTQTVVVPVYATLQTPEITADQVVCIGYSAAPLTSTVTGGNPGAYTYQWQRSNNGTSGWTNITGANSSTYTPPTQRRYYRLVVTSCGTTKISNVIRINTSWDFGLIGNTTNPDPVVICSEESFTNTSYAISFGGLFFGHFEYQWKSQNPDLLTSIDAPPIPPNTNYYQGGWPLFEATVTLKGTNNTNTVASTNLIITPSSYNVFGGHCNLNPITVPVTINPVPKIFNRSITVCSDESFNATPINGVPDANTIVPASTTYSWSIPTLPSGVSGATSGTNAASISQTLSNTSGSPQIVTYTITPTYNGLCTGNSFDLTVTVNPTPSVNSVANQTVCNGDNTTAITFSGGPAGTIYSWTNSNPSIGIGASGTSNIPAFTSINNSNVPVTANFTVFPSYSNAGKTCSPATGESFSITVNPTPVMNNISNQVFCNTVPTGDINFSSSTLDANTYYTWTNTNTSIGLGASGSTSSPNNKISSFIATNPNTDGTSITGTITVTPYYGGPAGCAGTPKSFVVTVNPTLTAGTINGNSLVCIGDNSTFTTTGGNTGGTWSSSQPTVATINATTGQINATGSGTTTITYTLNGCNGPSSSTFVLTVSGSGEWRGINSNWNDPINWCNGAPTLTTNVTIPVLGPGRYYPIIDATSGTGLVRNITIASGANLTINEEVLQIAGNITNGGIGNIDATAGTIELKGTGGTQNLSGHWFADRSIETLIVGNNASVSNTSNDTLNITKTIRFNNTNAGLSSGDNITLKSTKAHTANLGKVGAFNVVSGAFTVERYINIGTGTGEHGKAWHVIAPNTNGQTIKESWMENGNNSVVGYGVNLTGTSAGGGWDDVSPAPAIKYYSPNSGQGTWIGAANSGVNLNSQNAWMVFVRGDRSVTGQWDPPKPTTLRSKGTVNTGNVSVTVPGITGGFYLLGNPYPSAIDVRDIAGLGTTGTYYIWNPNFTGIYGLGAYQTFTYEGGNYVSVPHALGKPDTTNNEIQSGQGFFVQTFPTSYNVVFEENAKVDGSNNTMFFRGNREGGMKVATLRSNIYTGDGTLTDGTLQFFSDEYSNGVDMADARKMMNSGINFSIKVDNELLVAERRQPLMRNDTIFLNLTGAANGKYRLGFEADQLSATGLEGWIEDGFTGTRTLLNMEGITNLNFDITSDAKSKAANRFRIVFDAARGPLPVTFVKVNAVRDGNDVKVTWDVANEINLNKYVVMKSADGNNFHDLTSINASGKKQYSVLDDKPLNGYNYYRIRSVDKDGSQALSPVAKVWMGGGEMKIGVFPNPIKDGIMNLRFENAEPGKYAVRMFNPAGQLILARQLTLAGGTHNEKIPWDYKMAHGTYQLEIYQPDGSKKMIVVMY